jgi:hypothetical protein
MHHPQINAKYCLASLWGSQSEPLFTHAFWIEKWGGQAAIVCHLQCGQWWFIFPNSLLKITDCHRSIVHCVGDVIMPVRLSIWLTALLDMLSQLCLSAMYPGVEIRSLTVWRNTPGRPECFFAGKGLWSYYSPQLGLKTKLRLQCILWKINPAIVCTWWLSNLLYHFTLPRQHLPEIGLPVPQEKMSSLHA